MLLKNLRIVPFYIVLQLVLCNFVLYFVVSRIEYNVSVPLANKGAHKSLSA